VFPPHASHPPYALAPLSFRFAALAALAGRAPMGGQREVALATYVAARIADDTRPEHALSQPVRAERAGAARSWLSSLTLPTPLKAPLAQLVDASIGDSASAASALRGVMAVTANYLDSGARSELAHLADALETQALVE
jgi:hypothetical protein